LKHAAGKGTTLAGLTYQQNLKMRMSFKSAKVVMANKMGVLSEHPLQLSSLDFFLYGDFAPLACYFFFFVAFFAAFFFPAIVRVLLRRFDS
jgi:hypothetical protein